MVIATDNSASYVFTEANLEVIKDRLERLFGVELEDTSNRYEAHWATDDGVKPKLRLDHNFSLEHERYEKPSHKQYPSHLWASGIDDPDAFDNAIANDPVLKGVRVELVRTGEPFPTPNIREELGGRMVRTMFGVDSDDLGGVARWLADRFDLPMEFYDSPQWGPYYRTFDQRPNGKWIGDWRLWFNRIPPHPAMLTNPEHPDWRLILFVVSPPNPEAVVETILAEAPAPVEILKQTIA